MKMDDEDRQYVEKLFTHLKEDGALPVHLEILEHALLQHFDRV
jgi:hypothetical protein